MGGSSGLRQDLRKKKPMNDSVLLEMEPSISDACLPLSKHVTQCGTHHATVCAM